MDIRDLDRLVSKTEMTPASKTGLKTVRRAVMSGRVGDAENHGATWSVSFDSDGGSQVTMNFSYKRDTR